MRKPKIVFKARPLEKLLLERLKELQKELKLKEETLIPYSNIRSKVCRDFSIDKQKLKEILDYLNYAGFISMKNKGIKLNFFLEQENE